MPVRIVHTADVHLDAAFAGLGSTRGGRKRQAIRGTFRRIIDECLEWPADVLLVAGDLFDGERVSPDTVAFLRTELARLGDIPAVISPGNHDPFTEKSPYSLLDWGANVRIFKSGRQECLELTEAGLAVCGVAHTSTHMAGRLADLVEKAPRGGLPCVLVAHASLQMPGLAEKSPDDIWLPFSAEELAALSYAYAALGHYHNPREITASGRVVGAYPGAPEGLSFSEIGRRHYLKVVIDGAKVRTERVPISEMEYLKFEIPCDKFVTREQLFDAIGALGVNNASRVLARVVCAGRVQPTFSTAAETPEELVRRFFHLEVADQTTPDYDWSAVEREENLRGEVARLFAGRLEAAGDQEREMLELARLYAIEALEGRPVALPPEVTRVD